jgi:hypothetical protein
VFNTLGFNISGSSFLKSNPHFFSFFCWKIKIKLGWVSFFMLWVFKNLVNLVFHTNIKINLIIIYIYGLGFKVFDTQKGLIFWGLIFP